MSLAPGTRIGVYDISSPLGAGGMGEVYRARDSRLNRDVALKILPDAFALDPERLARFKREAQVLASLNHPNIAAIYGLEETNGVDALVMELVEGPTLADRIERGPVPIDEALPIARQIAEGLEAAHEQGIIHRDLKPANIKLRPDGTVKVLDFGLARSAPPAGQPATVTNSPTITTPAMTHAGIILGTAAYMSPEQARGKPVDKRADIWAFGAVLFEMITGRRAFPGDEITDAIVSIVSKEPDWDALPTSTPPGLRRLIARCLKKDPRARMRDIGEARQQIDELLSGVVDDQVAAPGPASPLSSAWRIGVAAAALVLVGVAILGLKVLKRAPLPTRRTMRLVVTFPPDRPLRIHGADRDLVVSPDGAHLVYVSRDGQLMLRELDQLDALPLGGITDARSPFFSPDGRWVGVFVGGQNGAVGELQKVSIMGGPSVSICRYQGNPRGATWGPDDTIVFATNDEHTGLLRVSASGGQPTVLTSPDPAHGEADHIYPAFLPDGRALLFTIRAPNLAMQLAILELATNRRRVLIPAGSQPEYVSTGHLVYAQSGGLRAVRFDPRSLSVDGDPVQVVDQVVTMTNGAAEFSISQQGTLVYAPGTRATEAPRSLVWVSRQGKESPLPAPPRGYVAVRISPDGGRAAFGLDGQEGIWIWDFAHETLSRLTTAPAFSSDPLWTPDGRRVIFASSLGGIPNVFWRAADNTGSVERLTDSANAQVPTAITPDGTRVIVREIVPATGADLRVLRLGTAMTPARAHVAGVAHETEPLLQTAFNESNGALSPDGHWLAYESNDSGPPEISVRPFPNVDSGHWSISSNGGTRAAWSRNGRELFYLDGRNALMAVSVQTEPTFRPDHPRKLFDTVYYSNVLSRSYDVSPDGQRFLMVKDSATSDNSSTRPSVVAVVNWTDELQPKR